MYAKIDTSGNVIQFPYRFRDTVRPLASNTVPADAVEVDESNKPFIRWDQIIRVDSVNRVADKYFAVYSVHDRYQNESDKLKGITDLKNMHVNSFNTQFDFKVKELKSSYPDGESESWTTQRLEAKAYTLDSNSDASLIRAIALARGMDVSILATKIIENSNAHDAAYGALLGKYQKNKEILASIDLANSATWNAIDNLVRL